MRKQSKLVYTDSGDIHIESWLQNLALERVNSNSELLREACILARYSGEDRLTANGESCLHQGLAMAEILADLNLDDETLAAALVYSCIQNADLSLLDVEEHLGERVRKLVEGTRQMEAVHALHGKLTQRAHLASTIDNLRKMLLAMVDDVRVVLIKLAERLCILRNMILFNEEEKGRFARETMDVFAPLANRLGIGHLKWQLEDLSFRYLAPQEYQRLSRGIKDRRIDREEYVRDLITLLKNALNQAELSNFEVSGRAKHIYSIYRKMERKRVSLEEIYDAIALRILVPHLDDCYAALSVVHSLWPHISKEFDDYINHPKANGYRSIHTAVEGPNNKFVEIQIRTFDMHQEAELGVAAHWVYKEGAANTGYDQKIAWLRQVMDWQKEVTEAEKNNDEFYSQLFEDRIYVFTPNGDVIDLPAGATPLDFAYHIHSELGHRCRGAKINGSIVPLTHALNSGEKVEILTAKQGHPSRDWLNPHHGYLKTPRARAKVLNWFRKQDYERNLLEGHELIEKELKRLGIKELPYDELAHQLKFKNREEVFVAVGRGDLRMHHVLQAIQVLTARQATDVNKAASLPEVVKIKTQNVPTDITIEGVSNLLTHLAKCCKPVPGDSIIGYVTLGRGVSIHRIDCQNLLERFSLSPDRQIAVEWGTKNVRRYPVDLNVLAYDRDGLIHDITALLANEHIGLISINASPNKKTNTLILYLTVEVDSIHPLSLLMNRISQLQSVINIHRE